MQMKTQHPTPDVTDAPEPFTTRSTPIDPQPKRLAQLTAYTPPHDKLNTGSFPEPLSLAPLAGYDRDSELPRGRPNETPTTTDG